MPTSNSARRVSHPPSSAANVFLFLVAFRLLNALAVRTFFQPDEFFQSLEPAWQIAFGHGEGKEAGAWVTWVSGFACVFKVVIADPRRVSAGMEPSAPILITSPPLRCHLQACRLPRIPPWPLGRRACGAPDRRAQNSAGRCVGNQRFLHMESCDSHLRVGFTRRLGDGMSYSVAGAGNAN